MKLCNRTCIEEAGFLGVLDSSVALEHHGFSSLQKLSLTVLTAIREMPCPYWQVLWCLHTVGSGDRLQDALKLQLVSAKQVQKNDRRLLLDGIHCSLQTRFSGLFQVG